MNKIQIETAIARVLGDLLLEGIVDAATGSVISDTELIFTESGQLRGKDLYIHTGAVASSPQARTIASYLVGSLGVVPAFSPVPTIGDKYNIYDRYKHSDYSDAIDSAMRLARLIHLIDYVGTLAIVATQWEYAVPSGFKYIQSLRIVPSVGTDYADDTAFGLDRNMWRVDSKVSGSRVIVFDPRFIDLDDYDDEIVLVSGQRKPIDFTVPTQNSEVPDDFLIMKAASIIAQRKLDSEADRARYGVLVSEASKLEKLVFRYAHPGSVLAME